MNVTGVSKIERISFNKKNYEQKQTIKNKNRANKPLNSFWAELKRYQIKERIGERG